MKIGKEEFSPEFGECINLIREDYSMALVQYDTLNFLNQDTRVFNYTATRENLEKKIKAYQTLFPFFE